MTGDAELRALLRALDEQDRDSRLSVERRDALRERIMARSGDPSAVRPRRTMWDFSARWARTAVPVSLAASILAAIVLLRAPMIADPESPTAQTLAAYEGTDDAHAAIRKAAYGQVGSAEMLDSLVGPATRDALYSRVLRGGR